MKRLLLFCVVLVFARFSYAQETFPVNGAWDVRPGQYAFTNATIVVSADQSITNGTLLVKDRTIEAVGQGVTIPKGYVTVDLKGKYIYPGLVDAYSTYGIPAGRGGAGFGGFGGGGRGAAAPAKPGAYGWNEAVRPDSSARTVFHINTTEAENLKKLGFGAVQSLIHDRIVRGTSVAVTLADARDNLVMLNDNAAANYSFVKGSAATNYPSSLMGTIALIRQTYYDADWYKTTKEEYNLTLDAFNKTQNIPQIFECTDVQSVLRAAKLQKEFGKNYIFKTNGDEYQRIDAMKATGSSFIIPVNFPAPLDVEDPVDAHSVSFEALKAWELAPTNPAAMEKAGIRFAITSYGVSNARDFWGNIRTAMTFGLTEKQALNSLTTIPAEMIGVSDKVGTIAKGKVANFLITSDDLFKADNVIYENWVQGQKYVVSKMEIADMRGKFSLTGDGFANTTLTIGGQPGTYNVSVARSGADSTNATGSITRTGDQIMINVNLRNNPVGVIRMSGYIAGSSPLTLKGEAIFPDGRSTPWTAIYTGPAPAGGGFGGGRGGNGGGRGGNGGGQGGATAAAPTVGPVIYPFGAYGNVTIPKAENVLLKNATVWTNEKEGILKNADVLIENGKIKAVGKNLSAGNARVIDCTNKHITAGIVDEHSHIAVTSGVNEGTHSVTSEVRIGDVLNANDINLYRQLAGGVTTSHILHGSANAIGGQTQLIKHRWGMLPEELKFEGADGFIKFALGENVKGSNGGGGQNANPRFPQTRMGVEEVYIDAFTRAKEYKAARAVKGNTVRRDLQLEALAEILDNKRFITCHSYVQSEINMLMHVGDSLGFHVNTFTHILEGYKVADKMKAHGAAGSTFSDWWAYKNEVAEAIPYNGKLMHEVGLVTGFNSDDEEMARRLNQEAGKAVTYGKVSEEEALKFVTLNPAKMLHVDNKIGSLKAGKDADVVVWSADPLSIYAVCEKTYVDGVPYWDLSKDAENQKAMKAETGRLIQKMIDAKGNGAAVRPAAAGQTRRPRYECETLEEDQFVVKDDYTDMERLRAAAAEEARRINQ